MTGEKATCGCVVGGLHRYACAGVGHVDPPSTPTPVPSEVAETTAGEREVEAVLCLCHEALCPVHDEASGPFAEYDVANLTTALAALLDRVRREEGARIAQAIEELPAHYVQSTRRGGTGWVQAVQTHEAVTIARAASVGRGEGQ